MGYRGLHRGMADTGDTAEVESLTTGLPSDGDVFAPGGTLHWQWQLVGTWGLHADLVWPDYTGSGVLVAVLDDGFQYTHPELAANYRVDLDFDALGNDSDAAAADADDNHGTAVMGTILADDNGTGTVGVAFDAQGIGIRMGNGAQTSIDDILEGFQYLLTTDADVMNNSWGFTTPYSDDSGKEFGGTDIYQITDVMSDLAATGRDGLGTNLVFAAGNSRAAGDNVNYHNFQNSPYAITVGAIQSNGTFASFSTPGASILVSAAGQLDWTIDRTGAAGYGSGDYNYFSGTSAAAPVITGLVALMLDANPDLGWRDVQQILAYSAQFNDPASAGWHYNGAVNWNGGGLHFSHDYGFGAADAFRAVRLAETWDLQQTSANMTTVSSALASPALAIPATGTVTTTINMAQNVSIEKVLIDLDISHSKAGDLVVTLISPTGTESVLVNHPGNGSFTSIYGVTGIDFVTSTNADRGEGSAGTWTLRIEDTVAGNAGILNNWQLTFMGSAPSANDLYVFTNDFGNFSGADLAARSMITDTDGGTDTLNLATVTSNSTVNLNTVSGTIAGKTVTFAGGTIIENIYGGDGNDILTGNAANNSFHGGRGNDTLQGMGGDDTLDGGRGVDTVLYALSVADFSFTFVDAVTVVADCIMDLTGTDTLLNIENFSFLDGLFSRLQLEDYSSGAHAISLAFTQSAKTYNLTSLTDGSDTLNATEMGFGTDLTDYVQIDRTADSLSLNYLSIYAPSTIRIDGGNASETLAIGGVKSGIIATVYAGAGNDVVSINLAANSSVYGGDGNDTLTGGAGKDSLYGESGNDALNGGLGIDAMAGGAGDDAYIVDNGYDVVTEALNAGTDTVSASVTHTLSANVENLILTGIAAIGGTGNALNNTLTGNTASNILNGGGGADTMTGGLGNDTYVIDNASDAATENPNEGIDTVKSGISYALAANIENLTLTGAAAINATGNALNNILTGNSGANILDGGLGLDKMAGGAGDDTYVVGTAGDSVTEGLNMGTDTVLSAITYTLTTNVELLTLTGASAINGTGNTLNNTLTGNTAANLLNGGLGADTMAGGAGNDTYIVDNAGDIITENLNQGIDTVQSVISYALAANVENLTLTGTALSSGTGNDLANILTGNAYANTLIGGLGSDTLNGGGSADTLIGGAGNDLYIVDNIGDILTENAGEGTDTVQSSVSLTLSADFENLTLSGSGSISGTGNAGNNVITGNNTANILSGGDGNDTLIGAGGLDQLTGGLGADTFVIRSLTEGADIVKDFSMAQGDKLDISDLLTGFDPQTELLSNFVRTVASGSNTVVQVDASGSGASYLTATSLEGVSVSLATLVNDGHLIVV